MFVALVCGGEGRCKPFSRCRRTLRFAAAVKEVMGTRIHLKELPDSPLFASLQPPLLPAPPSSIGSGLCAYVPHCLDRQDARQLAGR